MRTELYKLPGLKDIDFGLTPFTYYHQNSLSKEFMIHLAKIMRLPSWKELVYTNNVPYFEELFTGKPSSVKALVKATIRGYGYVYLARGEGGKTVLAGDYCTVLSNPYSRVERTAVVSGNGYIAYAGKMEKGSTFVGICFDNGECYHITKNKLTKFNSEVSISKVITTFAKHFSSAKIPADLMDWPVFKEKVVSSSNSNYTIYKVSGNAKKTLDQFIDLNSFSALSKNK